MLSFTSHFDYFRCHAPSLSFESFNSLISLLLSRFKHLDSQQGYYSLCQGIKSCEYQLSSLRGLRLIYNQSLEGYSNLWLDLSGKFFSDYSAYQSVVFMKELHKILPRVSRIDTAIDFYNPNFSVSDIRYHCVNKMYSGFIDNMYISSYSQTRDKYYDTITLGSRESGKYTRIYDTFPKHNFEGIRVECEYKRDMSRSLFDRILTIEGQTALNDLIINSTLKHINFHSVPVENRILLQSNIAPFWSEILKCCNGSWDKLKVVKEAPTLKKTFDWLQRQCSKSLAVLKDCYGDIFKEELYRMIATGRSKYTNFTESLIKEYQALKFEFEYHPRWCTSETQPLTILVPHIQLNIDFTDIRNIDIMTTDSIDLLFNNTTNNL